MKRTSRKLLIALIFAALLPLTHTTAFAGGRGRGGGPPTLGLDNGTLDFDTPDFTLKLVKDSQTIAAMQPKGAQGFTPTAGGGRGGRGAAAEPAPFDFTPAYVLSQRAGDGYNHLGDVTFRIKQDGYQNGAWVDFTSSAARKTINAVTNYEVPAGYKLLAAAELSATLTGNVATQGGRGRGAAGPAIADCPLQVSRAWLLDATGKLVLHFDLKNKSTTPLEIGALGIPVIFNNDIPGNNRAQGNALCSFFDPYVGQDAGYLQVTRLSGGGPALLVTPETGTKTPFEAYRKINDATGTTQTFEGAFEWMVHSKAYADAEWRNAQQWNPPTNAILAPGQTVSHGLRFLLSPGIRDLDKTLVANKAPSAVGVPGYIIPMDLDAKLFLNPAGRKIASIDTDPPNAITTTASAPAANGYLALSLKGNTWGRARLTVTYDDGTKQAIHYYVTKPATQAVADLGNFLFTKQWFDDPKDPFHRSPSIMTYDRTKNQIVTQDSRVWIAGLGDEGGSSWLTGAMKEFGQPKKAEVDKFAEFVDKVLWGQLQITEGNQMYGVRKSLFYYEPNNPPAGFTYDTSVRWAPTFPSWPQRQAVGDISRAYDYPHVVAAYWAMYRLARNNPGLVTAQKWEWYLDHAYQTTRFLSAGGRNGVSYGNTGLMEGDVFVFLLQDLKREGWNEQATTIETAMKRRADTWNADPLPFGSEMAWDSTGQEEVYAWTTYFGYTDKANICINSILGYMPTIPHWGYNGNARRYWDFQYGGAPGGGIERQLHHYGSGINAIPMLAQFRQHPDDFYLLRVGYGGAMGALSNIDQEGFASAAFHSYPQNLRWDAYSGDYAQNFFGHAVNAATYVVKHPDFGWLAFGGNMTQAAGGVAGSEAIAVQPLDSFRKRIYIAPFGLYLTLDAGTIDSVLITPGNNKVQIVLSPKGEFTPEARIRIEQPAKVAGIGTFAPAGTPKEERGAYVVTLGAAATTLELSAK